MHFGSCIKRLALSYFFISFSYILSWYSPVICILLNTIYKCWAIYSFLILFFYIFYLKHLVFKSKSLRTFPWFLFIIFLNFDIFINDILWSSYAFASSKIYFIGTAFFKNINDQIYIFINKQTKKVRIRWKWKSKWISE